MTNKTNFDTPKYVLKSGNQPIALTINSDDPTASCVCVYGFSDKLIFDAYKKNDKQPLIPYPLVKGYLANQIATAESAGKKGADTGLVILDATGPTQPTVFAATMAAVLNAQEENTKQVPIEFELIFNSETDCYFKHDFKETPAVASKRTAK